MDNTLYNYSQSRHQWRSEHAQHPFGPPALQCGHQQGWSGCQPG